MNKDLKYILKRVLIGVLIALIITFIKSCNVNASTLVTPDAYFKINNIESFPASLDNYATYSIEYAYPAGGIEYNYLILETCTQGSYNEFYIYSDACNNSCFEPGTITTYKAGSCTTNNSAGSKVIFQIRVKKTQLMPDTLYNRVNNRIRFVGAGKTEIYSFYGSDTDVITQLATMQQNTQNIINQITSGFSNSSAKQDAINDSVNDLNDTMKDDSPASNSDFNDAINSVTNALPTNSTIASLVTMPITFIQKIIDGLGGTCSAITIGDIYGYTMVMPCINPADYIGVIWNIIDVICAGFFAFIFGKKLVVIFHNITSMREGGLKEAYD